MYRRFLWLVLLILCLGWAACALGEESILLPCVEIQTENNAEILSREEYVSCTVSLEGSSYGARVRVRGNTSAYNGDVEMIRENPVPYKIKFDEKVSVLGLNGGEAFKDWVLLVADYNLVHTSAIFRLGRAMGRFFTADSRLVRLRVNQEDKGLYLLCDQKEVKKHRVNVYEPEEGEESIRIGYFVEIDHYAEKDSSFLMKYDDAAPLTDLEGETRTPVKARYSLQSDFYSQDQLKFIGRVINNIYTLIRRACVEGKYYTLNEKGNLRETEAEDPRSVIEAVFDLEAAVDMYILQEMSRNGDVGKGSFFMCMDFSEDAQITRLTFTCPWDFTIVVDQAVEGYQAATFFGEEFVMNNGDNSNPWFVLLLSQDWFRAMVRERLAQLREDGIIDQVFDTERAWIEKQREDLLQDEDGEWRIDGPDGAYEELKWMQERLSWLEEALP